MTLTPREAYALHLRSQAVPNSRKASSYLRALDLLGPVLAKSHGPFATVGSIWDSASIPLLSDLYAYVLDQQKREDTGIFAGHPSPSYADNGFYSAALRDYRDFLIVQRHEQRLWEAYRAAPADPHELGRRLDDQPLEHADVLVSDLDIAISREGRDALRLVKTRVNQDFFRKMVLDNYGHRCCLTGIPVPQVLRASHIVPWSEDEANRLNPANGLCLSATYDAAFDAHMISFDEDLKLLLSPKTNDFTSDESFYRHFKLLEGNALATARMYPPDRELMALHRDWMCVINGERK